MPDAVAPARVFRDALLESWRRRLALARGVWLPMLAMVALYGIVRVQDREWTGAAVALSYLGYFVWGTLVAVPVHRVVLLGETPRWWPGIGARELRFLLWVAGFYFAWLCAVWLLALVVFVASLGAAYLFDIPDPLDVSTMDEWFPWLEAAAAVPVAYLAARGCLVFPQLAVRDRASLRESWSRTRGNGWRVAIAVSFAPWAIALALERARDLPPVAAALVWAMVAIPWPVVQVALVSVVARDLEAV